MREIEERIEELINSFSEEAFLYFLEEKKGDLHAIWEELKPTEEEKQSFGRILFLAEGRLEDEKKFGALCIEVKGELSHKSGRKRQFELARRLLIEKDLDVGLFAFYDENRNFRLSLVYALYEGIKRSFSTFKRYTYFVERGKGYYTLRKALLELELKDLQSLQRAFSTERLTEKFFNAYRSAVNRIRSALDRRIDPGKAHAFAQQLLSRIMFVYFLQKKGWLKWKDYVPDREYMLGFWKRYRVHVEDSPHQKDTFFSKWLSSLFFGAFNKRLSLVDQSLPEDIRESLALMPYLNGGLFTKNELDLMVESLPDEVFEWLFEPDPTGRDEQKGFLQLYNFTVDESMPLDEEVAVDPEMLGKVYESLIAEEERSGSGIFYTPRLEIDFMCRLALTGYLEEKTGIERRRLLDFVYNPETAWLSHDELRSIRRSLEELKVVDPAVGSASFLVGMLNILVSLNSALIRNLEGKEPNLFALKRKIVQDNLYGVDVKDWAVMVGELRLWLSLVIESDEKEMDIYTKPLLPNFSFKLRQGDSLIEEVGGTPLLLRAEGAFIPSRIKKKLQELIDRKNRFYSGEFSSDLRELEQIHELEREILLEVLKEKLQNIEKDLQKLKRDIELLSQKDMYAASHQKESLKELREKEKLLKQEKEEYQRLVSEVGKSKSKDYFLWEIDFAEVFEKGGFDIVIGNPPYVRQEEIAPPLEKMERHSEESWKALKEQYKEKLLQSVKRLWGHINLSKRSDLYVYFFLHGLSLLREGGILCFITSNSWLDVGYGAGLQEFFLNKARLEYVIDNLVKRSFKEADVNTVITLARRRQEEEDYRVRFVSFRRLFEEVNNAQTLKELHELREDSFDHSTCRLIIRQKSQLLQEGTEEDNRYTGSKWGGKYLRAPEIYFKILEKGRGKLVRLGNIAEVRFGIKTGANEFFYLKPMGLSVKEVVELSKRDPDAPVAVRNSAGWEGEIPARFLKPVVKSPRELKSLVVRLEDLSHLVFMCHGREKELKDTEVWKYIKWGEKQGYHKRPTCSSRERWWDLGERGLSTALWTMTYRERFFIPLNKVAFADARLYDIYCSEELLPTLNSAYCLLWIELQARGYGGGGGPVDVKVYEVNEMLIPSPEFVDSKEVYEHIFTSNSSERLSIFTELGFDPSKPIREQEPNPLPDRKAIDDVVFDALGLTEDERREVYYAVAELVQARLEKARSV